MERGRGIIIVGNPRSGKIAAIEALQEALKNRVEIVGYGVDFGKMEREPIGRSAVFDDGFIQIEHDSLVLMESESNYSPGRTFSFTFSIDESFKELQLALEKVGVAFKDHAMHVNEAKEMFEEMKQTIIYEKPQSKFISRPRNNFRRR